MKRGLSWLLVGILAISFCYSLLGCGDDTVTYYRDTNGNNQCDWGEAVYYEDNTGTHWLD